MLIRFCLRHTKKPKIACFYRLTVALPSPGWYSWLAMKPGFHREYTRVSSRVHPGVLAKAIYFAPKRK